MLKTITLKLILYADIHNLPYAVPIETYNELRGGLINVSVSSHFIKIINEYSDLLTSVWLSDMV